jgi:hypothetical protein
VSVAECRALEVKKPYKPIGDGINGDVMQAEISVDEDRFVSRRPQIPTTRILMNHAGRVTLPLERYSTRQPSRFAIKGSRSAASHLPIVSRNEAIRKTACAILPTKQSFFQCRLIFN